MRGQEVQGVQQPAVAWSCVLIKGCAYPASCGPDYCRKEHFRISGEGANGMSVTHAPHMDHLELDPTGIPVSVRKTL